MFRLVDIVDICRLIDTLRVGCVVFVGYCLFFVRGNKVVRGRGGRGCCVDCVRVVDVRGRVLGGVDKRGERVSFEGFINI